MGEEPKYELSEEQLKRIINNFTYHPPKDDQVNRYENLRHMASTWALYLCANCPQSRELSLALTHLEEAVMWANAAIARNE